MASHLTFLTAVALMAALVSGCDQAKSQSRDAADPDTAVPVSTAPGNSAVPRPALVPNAAPGSPHFTRVMNRLDVGGKRLHYQDDEGRRETIIAVAEAVIDLFPEDELDLEIDVAELIDALGIAKSAASGRSLRKDGESWLTRGYSYYPDGHSPLAKLLGSEAVPFRGPTLLPAATDLLVETRLDASALPGVIRRVCKAVGEEDAAKKLLGEKLPIGQTVRLLFTKTDLHLVFGLDLSHWTDGPNPQRPVDFFLQIDGARGLLDAFMPNLEEALGQSAAIGHRRGWEIPLPPALGQPKVKAIILFDKDGRLTVASRRAYLDFVESDSLKLSGEKQFRNATNHFPKEGNLLCYTSAQLPPALAGLMRSQARNVDPEAGKIAAKLTEFLEPKPCSLCIAYEPDGIAMMSELPLQLDLDPTSALPVLSSTSIMFVGARAWKRGSDRAGCIMNIRNVQQAVRSYQNLHGLKPGAPIPWDELIGPDKFIEIRPTCPAGGQYTFARTIPSLGGLGCRCSHEKSEKHVPERHRDW